jgi:hypothetical protein
MVKCNACGGIYDPIGIDGVAYFHVCPPLSVPELAAAIGAGKVAAPAGAAYVAFRAAVLAVEVPAPPDAVIQARYLQQTATYARTGARNENPKSTKEKDAGTMVSAGAGVTPVASPGPAVVVVV